MNPNRATLVRVDDREGQGSCGACGREGLRWVAILSDGSAVGLECARAVIGYRPARRDYSWMADYRPVAEHRDCGDVLVLWERDGRTRETANGHLTAAGGVRREWERRGWLR
jgi:hypothetical protein